MSDASSPFVFEHVHIQAKDAAASAHWFADMLGAQIIHGPVRAEARVGGLRIFIEQAGEGLTPEPDHPHGGLDHIAFRVTDLEAVVAGLKAKGAVFTKDITSPRPGLKISFVTGPDGMSIELLEREPGA
ncbi:VOC family protein [Aquabacter sp. L1I39]|uniref:VOC family protein n=1 Tax=Aquabacter sp. L1I39 TaxID=2820278 RepID=UPI001ADC262B|nr:VOC family protein [Aquabacter sp. L1I39]QTL05046.1 VOC family protein [Aquabacter sp. L1I39]